MIYQPPSVDIFAFLKPFSPAVWLVMFATSVFVAIAVTLMEVPLRRILRNPHGAGHKFMNLQWASVAMLLQVRGRITVPRVEQGKTDPSADPLTTWRRRASAPALQLLAPAGHAAVQRAHRRRTPDHPGLGLCHPHSHQLVSVLLPPRLLKPRPLLRATPRPPTAVTCCAQHAPRRYIAVLSAQLTVSSVQLKYKGVADLADKNVGVFEATNTDPFKELGLQNLVPLPWATVEVRRSVSGSAWRAVSDRAAHAPAAAGLGGRPRVRAPGSRVMLPRSRAPRHAGRDEHGPQAARRRDRRHHPRPAVRGLHGRHLLRPLLAAGQARALFHGLHLPGRHVPGAR